LLLAAERRSDAQKAALRSYYSAEVSPAHKALRDRLTELRRQREALEKQVPTAMVMQDMPQPRDTFVLLRGEYDTKGATVTASTARPWCASSSRRRPTASRPR